MSTSLPSRLIYVADVPEIKEFSATFVYNFFVSDESILETSGIPSDLLLTPSDAIDSKFIQTLRLKTPRYVSLHWLNQVRIISNQDDDQQQHHGTLISDNLDKVISEEQFATLNYSAVVFSNADIDSTTHMLISGSSELLTIGTNYDQKTSGQKLATNLNVLLEKSNCISNSDLVISTLTNSEISTGVTLLNSNGTVVSNDYFDALKSVSTHVQLNSHLLSDIVKKSSMNAFNQHSSGMVDLQNSADKLKQQLLQLSIVPTDSEYKTIVPTIDLNASITTTTSNNKSAEIVGYIVDKHEIDVNGNIIQHPPIIVDNPNVTQTYDFKVKYNSTYVYSSRAIALYTIPATDDDTLTQGVITLLVSSKPSNNIQVKCAEKIAPPPPADISFVWNYETEKLVIYWAFPPNSQRDIKKFQVFRRSATNVPFELLKQYDFDDSMVKVLTENIPDSFVEKNPTPVLSYIDDDFIKSANTKFIYTLCCIDAHGLTSNYGAQFEVWFDVFKNKLFKKLISHSGAPKPYPNLYVEADVFVDTIRVSGKNSRQMKVYFNPVCYDITNNDKSKTRVISTKQKSGSYRISLFNTDNQTPQTVDITLDDRTQTNPSDVNTYSKSIYGPQK